MENTKTISLVSSAYSTAQAFFKLSYAWLTILSATFQITNNTWEGEHISQQPASKMSGENTIFSPFSSEIYTYSIIYTKFSHLLQKTVRSQKVKFYNRAIWKSEQYSFCLCNQIRSSNHVFLAELVLILKALSKNSSWPSNP